MCGRYSFNVKKDVLKVLLPGVSLPNDWVESLNICPTEQALAIHKVDKMALSFMRWGFQQTNAIKKDLPPYINARSETIFEKVNFKGSIVNRRCIIPADSFYEWKTYGKSKIPYRILPSKDPVLFMAGIWQTFESSNNTFSAFVIVTTDSNEDIAFLHNRMPVILDTADKRENWLYDAATKEELVKMMVPSPSSYLTCYPVANIVNNIRVKNGALHDKGHSPLTLF
jgi:putative SOS response-associated peptidase YedK